VIRNGCREEAEEKTERPKIRHEVGAAAESAVHQKASQLLFLGAPKR